MTKCWSGTWKVGHSSRPCVRALFAVKADFPRLSPLSSLFVWFSFFSSYPQSEVYLWRKGEQGVCSAGRQVEASTSVHQALGESSSADLCKNWGRVCFCLRGRDEEGGLEGTNQEFTRIYKVSSFLLKSKYWAVSPAFMGLGFCQVESQKALGGTKMVCLCLSLNSEGHNGFCLFEFSGFFFFPRCYCSFLFLKSSRRSWKDLGQETWRFAVPVIKISLMALIFQLSGWQNTCVSVITDGVLTISVNLYVVGFSRTKEGVAEKQEELVLLSFWIRLSLYVVFLTGLRKASWRNALLSCHPWWVFAVTDKLWTTAWSVKEIFALVTFESQLHMNGHSLDLLVNLV